MTNSLKMNNGNVTLTVKDGDNDGTAFEAYPTIRWESTDGFKTIFTQLGGSEFDMSFINDQGYLSNAINVNFDGENEYYGYFHTFYLRHPTNPAQQKAFVRITENYKMGIGDVQWDMTPPQHTLEVHGDTQLNGNLGLFGNTPQSQPVAGGLTTGFTQHGSTAVSVDSTFTGNLGNQAYTIGDIVRALKLLGVIAI
jgi:hypothetical protein